MENEEKKLKMLLEHLIGHNKDHAKELEELAEKIKQLGNEESYKHLIDGVEKLNQSNDSLEKANHLL